MGLWFSLNHFNSGKVYSMGCRCGLPSHCTPNYQPPENHPFKQDNSVHSLCIIGTYLLESGQAILVPGRPCWQASWRLHINCAESAWDGWFALQILHNYRGNTGHNNKMALPYLSASECHQKLPIAKKGGKSVFECFRLMNTYMDMYLEYSILWSTVFCFFKFLISQKWQFFFVAENQMFFPRFSQILLLKNMKKVSNNFFFFEMV